MADEPSGEIKTAVGKTLDGPEALSGASTSTDAFARRSRAQLLVLAGVQAGKRIPIRGETVVGRTTSATVCLPDPHISRQHVRIWQEADETYRIQDLGSHNGTAINGQQLDREPHAIRFGDKIRIGKSSLLLFSRYDNMEEQLLQSQKLEALGQLAGGVAHDFNNLLAVIIGNVGVIRTEVENQEVLECLSDIEAAAERAAGLTRQLLNFSTRNRSGQRLVDVSRLTQEASELARRTFDSAITIKENIAPGLHVRGDAAELHQVLMNLLVNARDAMPNGGQLTLAVRQAGSSSGEIKDDIPHVVLTVADSGVGMDEEARQRAFEPFYTTKHERGGTGLGLSTVYGVVQKHGGHVTVESAVDQGTSFNLWLPLTELSSVVDHFETAALGLREKRAVLIVDEQKLVLNTVKRLIRSVGFEPLCASNIADALSCLADRREDIQLALVDTQLRDRDGQSAFWALRQVESDMPMVVMSGYDKDDRVHEMLSEGAGWFLRKPFGRIALKEALDKTLGPDLSQLDKL